jgi:hypothetical protein
MSDLPRIVQRAPKLFYVAAVVYFVVMMLLTHFQFEGAFRDTDRGGGDSLTRLTLLSAWLQVAVGAMQVAAYGVISQILLAIWRNGKGRSDPGADE